MKESLIYSVVAFDGKDYSGTFCRGDADTIYLIGDVDNFLNVKKALVYYWDITQEWKLDLEHLNYTFEGQIELTDKSGNVEILESVKFTYYNAPGEYEINWRVFTGAEADREYAAYDKLMDEYIDQLEAYQNKQMELQVRFEEMIQQLSLLREEEEEVVQRLEESPAKKRLDEIKGKIEQARREQTDTSQLEQEKAALERDLSPLIEAAARSRLEILAFAELAQRLGDGLPAPEHPGYFVREPDNAFLFNLEPGEYSIRFMLPDGTTLEGSEKRVLVHEKWRENSIGYDVIPADQWTRPVLSQTPASVLYVDGTTDLYLLPIFSTSLTTSTTTKRSGTTLEAILILCVGLRFNRYRNRSLKSIIPGTGPRVFSNSPFMSNSYLAAHSATRSCPSTPRASTRTVTQT